MSATWFRHPTPSAPYQRRTPGRSGGASVLKAMRAWAPPRPFLAVLAVWVTLSASSQLQGPPRDLTPVPEPTPRRTDVIDSDEQWRTLALSDGEPLSFLQDPPLIYPRDDHGARLRDFTVAGDVVRVRFDRWNSETGGSDQEVWERQRTDTVGGRLVSVFQPSWSPDQIQKSLGRNRVGLDHPFMYLGSFRGTADAPNVDQSIYLRVGSSLARPVEVAQVDGTVQYSSHVVNLVIPGFGDRRLTTDLELETVARKFYEHFEDSYEVLAVVPAAAHLDDALAYHLTVQNQVEGTGMPRVSRSSQYGSAGTLLGIEAFHNVFLLDNWVSNHELTHTWGHAFDWGRIASITRGNDTGRHAPLMTGGESLVSAVLAPTHRAVMRADGSAVIERVPAPAHQHPLDLYAMGLLEPRDMPQWVVFEDQNQFVDGPPDPGTPVAGGMRRVSINDVMAAHGPRQGPVLSSLSRATIVVSRNQLLSAEEMAYWNYFSARLEDPTGSGVVSFDGQPSFDVTTHRRIDLKTDVRPKVHPQIRQPHDVDPVSFGATDCRGFEFTSPPRARARAGERLTVAGRVTARDRTDFNQVLVRLWPGSGDESRSIREFAEIGRSSSFSVQLEIREGWEGPYSVQLFLFWPNAGSQYPRCNLSPLVVSPPGR